MEETVYSSDSSSWDETISCNNVYDTKQENNQFMPRGFRLQSPNNVYLIERVLGHGSFGITYLARCNGKYVALKEFFMEKFCSRNRETFEVIGFNPGNLVEYYGRKFQQEATHLRKLKHDNIIQVFEAFWANHTYYYSMEYVDGCSLDAFLKRNGAMKESDAIDCMRSVLSAIEYLHSQKMLHLDLKPGNIMRRNDGHYYVIDFGLSKQFNEEGEPESSSTIGLGTKGYAPTEQGGHNGNVFAPWIDVYALGGCFFKMLTGNTPPDSSEVLNDGLPIDELKNKKISKATIKLIKAMMEPMWKNRIQDVATVKKRLPQFSNPVKGVLDDKESENGYTACLLTIPVILFLLFNIFAKIQWGMDITMYLLFIPGTLFWGFVLMSVIPERFLNEFTLPSFFAAILLFAVWGIPCLLLKGPEILSGIVLLLSGVPLIYVLPIVVGMAGMSIVEINIKRAKKHPIIAIPLLLCSLALFEWNGYLLTDNYDNNGYDHNFVFPQSEYLTILAVSSLLIYLVALLTGLISKETRKKGYHFSFLGITLSLMVSFLYSEIIYWFACTFF